MKRITTAYAIVHRDGALCKNLIRETRKGALKAQKEMFPNLTNKKLKELGFKSRVLTIVYEE